jgi:hypothetical protein
MASFCTVSFVPCGASPCEQEWARLNGSTALVLGVGKTTLLNRVAAKDITGFPQMLKVCLGLGRIVALYHRSPTLCQIR